MPKNRKHTRKRHVIVTEETENASFIDRATFAVAILEPLITIPQVITIFSHHSATGISLSTWVGYEVLTVVWVIYGITHKEYMILTYQGLFMLVQTAVIVGGVLYGAKW